MDAAGGTGDGGGDAPGPPPAFQVRPDEAGGWTVRYRPPAGGRAAVIFAARVLGCGAGLLLPYIHKDTAGLPQCQTLRNVYSCILEQLQLN